MAIDVDRPVVLVENRVVDGPVVVGPLQAVVGIGNLVGQGLARFQVQHPDGELLGPVEVHAVCCQAMVGAVFKIRDPSVIAALGKQVDVQQDFFRPVGAANAAAVDGVLAAFFEADVVVEVAFFFGNGVVVFLDAPTDLLVDPFLQGCQRGQERLGVFILGAQVIHGLWVFLIPKPMPGVDAGVAMDGIGVSAPGRGRRVGQTVAGGHVVAPVGAPVSRRQSTTGSADTDLVPESIAANSPAT